MADDKPVWMEDWSKAPISLSDARGAVDGPSNYLEARFVYRGDAERTALAGAAPALVRALLLAEWYAGTAGPCDDPFEACPACQDGRPERPGDRAHAPHCLVDDALTQAGFPDQASRDAARERMRRP